MKRFYDMIVGLRAGAAMIFDTCIANNTPKEEIVHHVKPINDRFDSLLAHESKTNPGEVALAITMLENNAGGLMQSSKFCQNKAEQEIKYAKQLRDALYKHMKESKHDHLEAGGFLVTLSADGLGVEIR